VIDKQVIYRKSAKGSDAIATRQAGLSPRLRSALIMVDGKRSYSDLATMVSVLGDPEALVKELESTGLIELVGGPAQATPGATSAQVPGMDATSLATAKTVPAALSAPPTLAGAKRFTARLLTELLGPMSEVLCVKIEAARDMADFITAVKRARDVVREVKGQAAATQFIEQVEAHTPAG
jgi:hypothetical protein